MDTSNLSYSADLWFDDGDIVLRAENTLFRVIRGILVYHSQAFAELFLQISSGVTVDGCSVLVLSDSADDLTHFLKAIHDPSYYDPSKDTPFSVISGILRISTKYQVHPLRRKAVRHLQRIFPSTIEAWDNRSTPGNDTVQKSRGRTLAVINLALETDHPILLPSAMAYSWAVGLDALLDGIPRYDSGHGDATEIETLDWQTKRTCLLARDKLTHALRTRLLAFILTPAKCANKALCDQGRLVSLQIWESFFSQSGLPTPFRFEVNWTNLGARLCQECVVTGKEAFLTARWVLWDELPSFFGLEGWETLERKADLVVHEDGN